MPAPHFFVSRYASEERHDRYVYRAVESILAFYPGARVTVVDDGSPPEFAYVPPTGVPNVDVVQNPFPRSGEVGTLAHARKALGADDDAAITLHDTMVLVGPVPPLPAGSDVCFLWHFEGADCLIEGFPNTLRLISRLPLPPRMMFAMVSEMDAGASRGCSPTWKGCFGVALYAKKKALDRMQTISGVFSDDFLSSVNTRVLRQSAERLFGIVAHLAQPRAAPSPGTSGAAPVPSLCGSIFQHPDAWSAELATLTFEEIAAKRYMGPFFKTWAGR
jgi:hypothetical protein